MPKNCLVEESEPRFDSGGERQTDRQLKAKAPGKKADTVTNIIPCVLGPFSL